MSYPRTERQARFIQLAEELAAPNRRSRGAD